MQKERITVTLDPDLVTRIDRLASLRDHSRSKLMELLLEIAVEEEEAAMKTLGSPVVGAVVQSIMDHPKILKTIAVMVGDRLTPEEVKKWQEDAPKIRRTRERLRDERGRRHDLRVENK